MVRVILVLLSTLLFSVAGSHLKAKIKRRSAAHRTWAHREHKNVRVVRNIVDDARNADSGGYVLGVARVNGQIVNVTFAEAYELYTRLNSHEERQEVLAPDTEGDAFGACGVRDEMIWPGNCETIEGNNDLTICRVPATGVTEKRGRNCAPLETSIQTEAHPTARTGVALINGEITTISRADAFTLYVAITGGVAQKRAVLAPRDNGRVFDDCIVTEQLYWPGNCRRETSIGLEACVVPSNNVFAIKLNGCVNDGVVEGQRINRLNRLLK